MEGDLRRSDFTYRYLQGWQLHKHVQALNTTSNSERKT